MTREYHPFFAARGPVAAVPAWRATPEQRERALSCPQAQAIVAAMTGDDAHATLRDLLALVDDDRAQAALPSHTAPAGLAVAVAAALDAGRLLLVAGWDGDTGANATAGGGDTDAAGGPSALVRLIMGRRGDLVFEGRRYRLVASRSSSMESARRGYRPVGAVEARELIKRMAAGVPTTPEAKGHWQLLAALVEGTKNAAGLVLLRFVPRGAPNAATSGAPVTTPSQVLAQVAPEDWIEIEVAYDDGTPFTGRWVMELPGGRSIEGDASGDDSVVRIDHLTAGTCKLVFPDVDTAFVKTA